MGEELLAVADELYALGPAEFTPARDARAKALKGTDLAAPVKKLRKPSVAAWVVNQLVRYETEQVDQVLAVGAALREAQANLAGDELRELTRQRRQLTAAVTTRARAVAAERGVKVTPAVADQVEATLTAAMIDESCAAAVRSGLLVSALATTGVDAADVAASVALPEALGFAAPARDVEPEQRPDLHVVPDPEADQKALRAAEESLEAAQARVATAQAALEDAAQDVSELEAASMQLQAELDELRRRIAELESRSEEVDEELGDAEDVRSEAEATVRAATKERDEARARLDRLRG
ncbi:MAG: hypothetical protein ACRDOM_00135 [Nocardioides sp.]